MKKGKRDYTAEWVRGQLEQIADTLFAVLSDPTSRAITLDVITRLAVAHLTKEQLDAFFKAVADGYNLGLRNDFLNHTPGKEMLN